MVLKKMLAISRGCMRIFSTIRTFIIHQLKSCNPIDGGQTQLNVINSPEILKLKKSTVLTSALTVHIGYVELVIKL